MVFNKGITIFEGQISLHLGCKENVPFRVQKHLNNQEGKFKSFDLILHSQELAKLGG